MNRTHGFTLLELLVVMVVATTLMLGGVISWRHWQQQQRLNASARQIQHFLLRLRNDANWHNQQTGLWQKGGKPWCLGGGPEMPCGQKQRRTLVASWKGIDLVSLTEGMGFYGRRNVAKPGRIVIASEAGERHIIVSSRGRVRICRDTCL